MLSQQEISDRLEIEEVLNRYFRSMDTKDYELLDRVFTPDAVVRYEALQGLESTYREMLPHFESFNQHFRLLQHIGAQMLVELDGDEAVATCTLRALHVQETLEGERSSWAIYGTYRDVLVRTPEGWRILERHFRQLHTEGEILPFDRVKKFPKPPDS